MKSLQKKLLERIKQGNLRELNTTHEGLIDFCSNDYLGLARSPILQASIHQELENRSVTNGSTGSRLLTGNTLYVQDLENSIAAFHGYEAGLLFNCGYMANVGLLSTIASSTDTLFFDANVHASTRDGISLSHAQSFAFRHNDLLHLENRLQNRSSGGNRFICIESIYSTDGSIAPLIEISALANRYGALLIVDEAHAVGIRGLGGRGLVAELGLCHQIFAQVTTFGKAVGTYGAIVMGSNILKSALINFSTPYIYTTALPFHTLAAIKYSYKILPQLESERKHLKNLIRIFCQYQFTPTQTPIQSVRFKGNEAVKSASKKLFELGFDVRPLMSPTVRRGHEALRICIHVFNTEKQIRQLREVIELICANDPSRAGV